MRLTTYLSERGETAISFAARIGVYPTTVYRLLNGVNFPLPATMLRIQTVTNGKVTPNDFYVLERRPCKKVRGRPRKEVATQWKEIRTVTSNEVTTIDIDHVPDWMKTKSTGAQIGNLDASDIKPPEIKLLQATSPETAEQPNARPGSFWLTGQNIDLGNEILGTPIILRRTYVIWNPTKSLDTKAPLAVASDAIHWDIPNQIFEVKFPNNPNAYTWKTGRTVAESGLGQFGSSRPEDPRSPPAASLTFQILWAFRLPDGKPQLGVVTNSRSGVKPARELFAMAEAKGVDHYFQRYRICAVRLQLRPGEYFFGYKYFSAGLVTDEKEGDVYKGIYDRFRKAGFSSNLSSDDEPTPPPASTVPAQTTVDVDEIPF
jgi:hypothetical protein